MELHINHSVCNGNVKHCSASSFLHVPCEERLCIICNSGNIEDEFHCFMSCSAYNYLRSQFFNGISNFDSTFSSLSLHQQFIYRVAQKKRNSQYGQFFRTLL